MLLSGFALRYLQHHACIAAAALIAGAGLFLAAASNSLVWFRTGLFLLGMGSGFYLPSGIATVTEIVRLERRGIAIAIHELGPILGLAAGPLLAEAALRTAGWRPLLHILGAVSVVLGFLYARLGQGGRFHGVSPRWNELRQILRQRNFWLIAVFFFLIIGQEAGVYSMLPAYLIADRGIDQTLVNSIVSTSRLTSLLIVFAAGWLADKFGYRWIIAVVALACGVTTAAIGFAGGWVLILAVYIQPMLISAFFPAGFLAMSTLTAAEGRDLTVSLVIPLGFLFGAGAVPAAIGRLAETGFFGLGFVIVGLTLAAGAALVPLFKVHRSGS